MSRIAFISGMSGFPWGGSEVLWSRTASHLLKAGHEVLVSVVGWPETPEEVRRLRGAGAQLEERRWTPASRSSRLGARLLRKPVVHPGWEPCWKRVLEFRPDLVCVSHGGTTCGLDWMRRALEAGVPYTSIAQANSEGWWPTDGLLDETRAAYLGSSSSFFVSKANLALFEKQIATRLPNAEVVCNPANVGWHANPAWPEAEEPLRLACVARLDPHAKGQDLLFEVLAKPRWRERPIEVTLFGKGPFERVLKGLVEQLQIGHFVKFAGHVSDIEEVWRTHHALVLPSRFEGLPLSLVEAMLCGRPAIVTHVAGNAEALEDDVTGFLAEAPTVRHLDDAMERAWKRRKDWQAIGAAAAASIRQQVGLDPVAVFSEKLLALCGRR